MTRIWLRGRRSESARIHCERSSGVVAAVIRKFTSLDNQWCIWSSGLHGLQGVPQGPPQGVPRKHVFWGVFWICWGLFGIFGKILRFLVKKYVFCASPAKAMQNHLEISSKTLFWTRNVPNWTKSRDLDMSGPAKTSPGGQVLVSKAGFCFYFFRNYTFPFFISKFIMFFENHMFY